VCENIIGICGTQNQIDDNISPSFEQEAYLRGNNEEKSVLKEITALEDWQFLAVNVLDLAGLFL